MISIAHRIELKPNNKQKTYFRKAFGCARLAYRKFGDPDFFEE
jgi:putative transposase